MSLADAGIAASTAATTELAHSELVRLGNNQFRIHPRAYTDPTVFAAEMDKIFTKTWVYVAHESEIPNAGDYKTSHVGAQPVIVSRSRDLGIHVLVNRCVHRGAVLIREAKGNQRQFSCPYHGWVYAPDGKLVSISERNEAGGYGDSFEAPEGLSRVARVETYRGLIFASFNPDAPLLQKYLGPLKTLIDHKFNLSPEGEVVLRSKPYVVRYQGNWKFQAENIVDAYHFMHTHKAFVQLQAKYGDSTGDFGVHKGSSPREMRQTRFKGSTWNCLHGHGMAAYPIDSIEPLLTGEFGDHYRMIRELHGDDELAMIAGKGTGTVFPNLGIIHQQIRVWRPIAPDLTEVTIYPYELKGAPEAFNEGMLRSQERFYGPAGYGMADDLDIFARNQQGLAGSQVDWMIMERGIETDELMDSGDYRGLPASEAPQRALWREWHRLMSAS